MKSRLGIILAAIGMVTFSIPSTVHAQNKYDEIRQSDLKNSTALNPVAALSIDDARPSSNRKLNGNPNNICAEGDDDCIDSEYEAIDPSLGNRQANVNYMGSTMGFLAGMNSEYHVEATVDKFLKGDLTLAYITMGLTEPAVAAGLAQAVNYVGHDVNNRMQSEQVFFQQLAYMPDVAEPLAQAHISCISTMMQSQQSWLTAQAACQGDTAEIDSDSDKGKFVDYGTGSQMNFQYDPYFNPDSDPEKILLSDYLFQRDILGGVEGAEELRDAFKEVIGDVSYSLDLADDPDKLGTRQLTYNKVMPTYSFDDKFKTEVHHVHEVFMEALKRSCDATDGDTLETADPFLVQLSSGGDNWKDVMSYSGFTPDITMMRAFKGLAVLDGQECPDFPTAYDWDTMIADPNNIPAGGREYIFISSKIAAGRIYSIFLIADAYLRKLNIGAFDNFARKAAYELLYEAAGTTNLQKLYDDNSVAYTNYLGKLAPRVAAKKNQGSPKGIDSAGGVDATTTNGVGEAFGGTS